MLRPLVAALSFLGLTACMAASAPPAAAGEQEYVLSATAPELKVGVASAITIKVDVKPGFHWNTEYPAKFELVGAPKGLEIPKPVLAQLSGDFAAKGPNEVAINVPATARSATSGEITVHANFSVCNERVCLMKTAKATVPIAAK